VAVGYRRILMTVAAKSISDRQLPERLRVWGAAGAREPVLYSRR
jgi:hypothetical protein